MQLNLSQTEADAKINQIDSEMMQVRDLANKILDSTEAMSSSWQGSRALMFRKLMAQHHEDFSAVLNNLQQVVEKGKSDIIAHVQNDSA